MSTVLLRIAPRPPYAHDFAGATGIVVNQDATHYTLSLRYANTMVRVPRSWCVSVGDAPMTAAEFRQQDGVAV